MKIEDKLEELGYKSYSFPREYNKKYENYIFLIICLSRNRQEIDDAYIEINDIINTQQGVDSIQKAFNILQKDLKRLQELGWFIGEN